MDATLLERARELLAEWDMYRHVHYGDQSSTLDAVIDLELDKDSAARLAMWLQDGIFNDECTDTDLELRIKVLTQYMRLVKDQITIELLKHG